MTSRHVQQQMKCLLHYLSATCTICALPLKYLIPYHLRALSIGGSMLSQLCMLVKTYMLQGSCLNFHSVNIPCLMQLHAKGKHLI